MRAAVTFVSLKSTSDVHGLAVQVFMTRAAVVKGAAALLLLPLRRTSAAPPFSTTPPSVVGPGTPAGTNPGAVDIDTRLGILAVAETGSNVVQFFTIATGALTPISSVPVNAPSGLSINQSNHTVAVVSYQDQSVVVFPLPGAAGAPGVTYPLTISLAGLIPSTFTPTPFAYSIGVDPDTNNAIVAYSSSANPTTAKIGFLLDLNKDTQTCLPSLTSATPPCIHA